MRKQLPEIPDLTEEELAAEMLELTCQDVDGLAKVFTMISKLCAELQEAVLEDNDVDAPDNLIH